MKSKNDFPSLTVRILLLAAAGLATSGVRADDFGLETTYRLVSTDAPSEIRVDTGLVASPTPLLNSDTNSGTKSGSTTSSSITVSNYYGNMSVVGSGNSANSSQQGSFAWIDTPVGGAPITKYKDYLQVESSTLAVGTDVTIDFTESFATSWSVTDPQTPTTVTFADDLYIYDSAVLDQWNLSLGSTGSASHVFHTKVGDTLFLNGELHVAGAAAYSNALSPLYSADFSFSMAGPLSITAMSAGVDLVSGSGASYAPSTASVPDGSSTAPLLAVGLALVLFRCAKAPSRPLRAAC